MSYLKQRHPTVSVELETESLTLSTMYRCYPLQCIRKELLAQSRDMSFMDELKLMVGDYPQLVRGLLLVLPL